jgi:hypothetical protein
MDWPDIAIHTGIAIVGMAILLLLGVSMWAALALNTAIWPVREAWQHRPDYREIITHPQSLLEWACPVVSGFIILAVL